MRTENYDSEIESFDTQFFVRKQNGERSQLFLQIAYQQDCAILQSLLAGSNIPSYIEGAHVNRLYGGTSNIFGTNIKLFILVNDYDKALDIVNDYVKSKKENVQKNDNKKPQKKQRIFEKLALALFAPFPNNATQKSFGIILYDKELDEF